MKARRRNFKKKDTTQNFWPSFTDMISTVALILFFLMLLMYIQNIVTGKNLEDSRKKLEDYRAEITSKEENLRMIESRLDSVKAELKEGERELKISEEKIEEQKEIIAESNKELGNLRAKLEGIAFLRVGVLKKVKSSLEGELGKTTDDGKKQVSIADNGNIVINENLVFDYNSYTLKPEGKELLSKLSEAFEKVLDDSNTRKNIDAINIQGHTDKIGSSEYNRELSTKRATAVVNYLMESNDTLEKKYGRFFMASGYSKFRPRTPGNTEKQREKNRRIEISLILKDSHVQNVIDEYLKDSEDILEIN
ncbi:MAG: OmpA family protein [Firmicutes bacterium]|nr:OmpA family protein [Bacillota bacterium]